MRDFWRRIGQLGDVPSPARARAAVLIPFYEDDAGDVRVILTKRPDWMRTHPGDVVFPGGRIERGETIVETAIREAEEEIGLDPGGVDVAGGLTGVTTRDPRNLIVPVVARVARPSRFVLEASEVAAVLEPNMGDLLVDDNWRTSRWLGRTMWFYDFPEGTMWGATAFMMRNLIGHLRSGSSGPEPEPEIEIRRMSEDDAVHVRRVLYLAATWNPDGSPPPADVALQHDELRRYHEDWGRDGDFGVAGFAGGLFLGGAFGRRFTHDDHGHGFIDEAIPEIAVGVEPGHRGRRLGGRLLRALEDVAVENGFDTLSLSVERANEARRLYDRLGWDEVRGDEGAIVMVRSLQKGRVTFPPDRTRG